MHGTKTGVITSKERSQMFKEVLPRGTIIECDPSRRVTDILKEFSRKAVDVALIDDEGLSDPEANELERPRLDGAPANAPGADSSSHRPPNEGRRTPI